MDVLEDLKYRGLINQITDLDGLAKQLNSGSCVLYCGFDVTADSLQLGNLLALLTLKRFQLFGHRPIALLGNGTSLIGDPSGKKTERILNSKKTVANWSGSLKRQMEKVMSAGGKNKAKVIGNYDWLGKIKMIDFVRDIGKHFSIGAMLAKESVKSRIETGISFTEFSYMLLQSYDFLRLHEDYGCSLQIGGSDQWGNITAGVDLIRKISQVEVYGLTFPLITKSDGTKFGKTESGAIWLDAAKTSSYQFYQFWINVDDQDVVPFLKYFTFLSREAIDRLEGEAKLHPEKREAQKVLAKEMTILIHGEKAFADAEKISQALFYGDIKALSKKQIQEALVNVPTVSLKEPEGIKIIDFLVISGVSPSKRQAKEDIE
ncbi:MAG TPA: tyrosine--tRNA ligase, partial [Candidatus Paceibacterota bacterium]|nr:tyrosine--tRNA ligase [Candidatus Paceibacterota bacterium]